MSSFSDFLKDLYENIDWGDIAGTFLKFILTYPNVYQWGFEVIASLFRIIDEIKGMDEDEAKASFAEKIHGLIDKPDLPMDFKI